MTTTTTTKTVPVSELSGAALDWAVANTFGAGRYWKSAEFLSSFHPSSDWSDGGPIIEREIIGLSYSPSDCRENRDGWASSNSWGLWLGFGSSPLVAAMRCYVASKLGDTVEVPVELLD